MRCGEVLGGLAIDGLVAFSTWLAAVRIAASLVALGALLVGGGAQGLAHRHGHLRGTAGAPFALRLFVTPIRVLVRTLWHALRG